MVFANIKRLQMYFARKILFLCELQDFSINSCLYKEIFQGEMYIFSLITGQNQVRKQVNLSLPLKLRERSLQKVNKPEKIRGF